MFSRDSESKDFSKGITLVFSNFTTNNAKVVIGVALSLVVLSYVGISKLTVENRFIDYFKSSTEIYKGMELLDQKLGGTAPLDIVLNAPNDWSVEEEEFDDDFGFEENADSKNGYWWNTISISRRIFVVIAILISFLSIANILKITQASSILRREQSLYYKVCTVHYKKIAKGHYNTRCDLL